MPRASRPTTSQLRSERGEPPSRCGNDRSTDCRRRRGCIPHGAIRRRRRVVGTIGSRPWPSAASGTITSSSKSLGCFSSVSRRTCPFLRRPRILRTRGSLVILSSSKTGRRQSVVFSDYQNFFLTRRKISSIDLPVPSQQEGRHAIVTLAGRDAVDAGGATDERAVLRTAKPCGSGAPKQASSSRGRQRVARMTGSTKRWSPGRARSKP